MLVDVKTTHECQDEQLSTSFENCDFSYRGSEGNLKVLIHFKINFYINVSKDITFLDNIDDTEKETHCPHVLPIRSDLSGLYALGSPKINPEVGNIITDPKRKHLRYIKYVNYRSISKPDFYFKNVAIILSKRLQLR